MGAPDADGRRGTQMWMGPAQPSEGEPKAAPAQSPGVRWMPSPGELPSFPEVDPTTTTAPAIPAPASSAPVAAPVPGGEPHVGDLIGGRYRLARRLGGGALTHTWEAEHVELGRRVALKFLRQQAAGVTDMMLSKARAVAKVQHPHVAGYIDSGRLPSGDPYFVMDLLSGETVASVLERKGVIPWARAVNIAQQVCLGLTAAHQLGIMHRDIRPGNVFLIATGNPADFAKVVDFALAQGTRTGGTPAYMSPEQCRHEQLDPRSDVYAVGCLLFAMVTGDPPFGAEGDNLQWRQLNEAPKSLRERAPRQFIPDELEAVVSRCLQKIPAQRYVDAAELNAALADLANFAAATSVAAGAIPTDLSQSSPMGYAGRKPPELERSTDSAKPAPNKAPAPATNGFSAEAVVGIVLASLAVVAVVGFGVWWLVSTLIGDDEAPPAASAPASTEPAAAPSSPAAKSADEEASAPSSELAGPAKSEANEPTADAKASDSQAVPADAEPSSTREGGGASAPAKAKSKSAASEDAPAPEPDPEPEAEPPAPKPTKAETKANENIGHDDLVDPWN